MALPIKRSRSNRTSPTRTPAAPMVPAPAEAGGAPAADASPAADTSAGRAFAALQEKVTIPVAASTSLASHGGWSRPTMVDTYNAYPAARVAADARQAASSSSSVGPTGGAVPVAATRANSGMPLGALALSSAAHGSSSAAVRPNRYPDFPRGASSAGYRAFPG